MLLLDYVIEGPVGLFKLCFILHLSFFADRGAEEARPLRRYRR